MTALHRRVRPRHARELEIAPSLWAGLGLVRPGPGTAIVGSPETVLRVMREYRAAGIETLSSMPLPEEACRFAELVLPHVAVNREPARRGGREGLRREDLHLVEPLRPRPGPRAPASTCAPPTAGRLRAPAPRTTRTRTRS